MACNVSDDSFYESDAMFILSVINQTDIALFVYYEDDPAGCLKHGSLSYFCCDVYGDVDSLYSEHRL
jgi:hypothetical protein